MASCFPMTGMLKFKKNISRFLILAAITSEWVWGRVSSGGVG